MGVTFSGDRVIKCPAQAGAARAEAAGLAWLRAASTAVVEVVDVTDTRLTLARVDTVAPTAQAARQAGVQLARIHRAGAAAFGAPPPGWDGPYFIGTQEQACRPDAAWGRFYAQQRVLPFARRAQLPQAVASLVERACAAIEAVGDWGVAPARIHGDLWAGNLLFSASGPVFIDPAAHGGHPVTDLAMLDLFGAPFLPDIFAGYESVATLPDGWRAQIPLHQLHPLAVHALTHGPGYVPDLARAAERTLELLG
ncbi:fructosamine kinase family protein [Corynebacterium uberis]|uniref:fructosamine kinase family protein n=1 Tax=Corynebacterium TaxID=1716 RepID=UPI001D0B77D1|nr:fructosamine kinase family protein [Corynebacterium uberis]MCZ9310199.1 fructosamine kinase family protein [Corynebacterium sp. c6VSa_13]UDL73677.1 fructosamine kinase family protein [Corynebacterium uberis]UDL75441.1 fructosamine kinase family protein [Corynebacterium uberis]UDL77654.1 fructosamine kinase family protein [Corynebacterium uberis]UDL79939.1 fructosamine kinase family protein [Corynebacterium uberis]